MLRAHTGDKPQECSHCDKAFSRKGYLKIQLRMHIGEKYYKCYYWLCESIFKMNNLKYIR